jgi:transposase
MIAIGIDVSAKTLDVCTLLSSGKSKHRKFDNDRSGHTKLLNWIGDKDPVIALEATGVYYLDVSFALARAGKRLMVVNPRRSKAFMNACGANYQTDKTDAILMAQFATRMPFKPWTMPSSAAFNLFKIGRAIGRLKKQQTRLKNQIHAESASGDTPKIILKQMSQHLKLIEKQIEELQEEAMPYIAQDPLWSRRYQLLLTIKGVGEVSALNLISELIMLPDDLSAAQWVKYAGLDPSRKLSGTSVQGKTKIAKTGNARLRAALYMPAMTASEHDPAVSQFRARLEANHKTPLQAIVAIQRKFLHGIHAMFRTDQPWESSRLFPVKES